MLQKENRLAKVRDFNLLFEYGRWVSTDGFTLKFLELGKNKKYFPPKEDPEKFAKQLRVAFTVGVKISKSAVKRNRLKRQAREVVRLLIKEEKLNIGNYLLFVAKAGTIGLEYEEIERQVLLLLKNANCLL